MSKYVIIGNSAAAIGCVEGIRSVDSTGDITIVSSEEHHVYSRPLISYLLQKKTDLKRMKYRPESFYDENHCDIIYKNTAASIDPEKKSVYLSTGRSLSYEKLLVAVGSSPFIPPMAGLESVPKRFAFSCLDDALALEKALTPTSRVLIIGAGLIGLKCAEGISGMAGSITIVDMSPRVLSSILDEDSSKIVQQHLEEHGLKLILSDSVDSFAGGRAILKSGQSVDFDILVTAVGVRANISLVKDAGGECGRGITIDSSCKTSLPEVYAAGDCTESVDVVTGQTRVMALLPNAYMQGYCAGRSMAGDAEAGFTNAMPMNSIGLFGLHIMTAGSYEGETYDSYDNCFKRLFYKDNRLVGFIIAGDTSKTGIYTSLIRNRVPLDTIDFPLICERPTLMAFSKETRKEFLGCAR